MSSHPNCSWKEAFWGEWGKEFLYHGTDIQKPLFWLSISGFQYSDPGHSWPNARSRTGKKANEFLHSYAHRDVDVSANVMVKARRHCRARLHIYILSLRYHHTAHSNLQSPAR